MKNPLPLTVLIDLRHPTMVHCRPTPMFFLLFSNSPLRIVEDPSGSFKIFEPKGRRKAFSSTSFPFLSLDRESLILFFLFVSSFLFYGTYCLAYNNGVTLPPTVLRSGWLRSFSYGLP